MAAQLYKVSTV